MNINTKKMSKLLPTLVSGLLTIMFYSMGWLVFLIIGGTITSGLFLRYVYDTFIKKYENFNEFEELVMVVVVLGVLISWMIYFQFIWDKQSSLSGFFGFVEFLFLFIGGCLMAVVLPYCVFTPLLKEVKQLFVSFWEYRKKIPTLEDLENSKRIVAEADRVISLEQE